MEKKLKKKMERKQIRALERSNRAFLGSDELLESGNLEEAQEMVNIGQYWSGVAAGIQEAVMTGKKFYLKQFDRQLNDILDLISRTQEHYDAIEDKESEDAKFWEKQLHNHNEVLQTIRRCQRQLEKEIFNGEF